MRVLFASIVAIGLTVSAGSALAVEPADPNCLGTDVSGFAQAARPLGQNVVTGLTPGGFNDEILGHLQGVPSISTCPDGGFPSHVP